jgi:hypothetical protein
MMNRADVLFIIQYGLYPVQFVLRVVHIEHIVELDIAAKHSGLDMLLEYPFA